MGTTVPKFIFNQPFLFFLRNIETGDILFAGCMSEPEAAKQPVQGPLSESELSELTQGIFTPRPAAGAGVAVSSTQNTSVPSNTYKSLFLAGSSFSTNSSPPIPQNQPTITNYYSSPNNLNTGNNFPSLVPSQHYQTPVQPSPTSNNPSQPNVAQYLPNINSASNPDTIGAPYARSPAQFLSTSGSYVSSTNSAQYPSNVNGNTQRNGVRNTNQNYNDRIHFSS
jgi:hypothetical protein